MKKIGSGIFNAGIDSVISKLIESGKVYSIKEWLTFGNGETKNFIFNPIPYLAINKRMFGFFPVFSAESGPITIDYYANPIATDDGVDIPAFNRNSLSPNIALSTFKVGPSVINNDGNKFAGDLVAASATGGGMSAPASTVEDEPFIINPNYKMLIRVHNLNGADTQVGIKFTFVEI